MRTARPWKKWEKWLISVLGVMFVLLTAIIVAAEPLSERDKLIKEYIGKNDASIKLTLDQGREFMDAAVLIHPGLSHPREIMDARSTCADLVEKRNSHKRQIEVVQYRFEGGDRTISKKQAEALLKLVKDSDFCSSKVSSAP